MEKKKSKGYKSEAFLNRKPRSTSYTEELFDKANDYIDNYKSKYDHEIPNSAGLASVLGVNKSTLYLWRKEEQCKPEWNDLMERLQEEQELVLLNKGLIPGKFTPAITSLVLGKHGYHKKVDNEHTGWGGGPIKTESKTLQVVGIEPDTDKNTE